VRNALAGISAVVVATIAIIIALSSHGNGVSTTPSGSSAAAQAPLTPAQRCAVTVLVLLNKTVSAMEDGYQGGIDVDQVMDEYGEQSAVFQAFAQLDGQVMGYVVQHGPAGSVVSLDSQPLQLCQEYGA
jgi:hypothetical protein